MQGAENTFFTPYFVRKHGSCAKGRLVLFWPVNVFVLFKRKECHRLSLENFVAGNLTSCEWLAGKQWRK